MLRNFYAEQKMTDPRDSWYKPNLLYIHYRPPKPPVEPRMTVVTTKFNPSVCTCGEHGCEPHYRLEREVVLSNEEAESKEGREEREMIQDERNVTTKIEDDESSQEDGDSEDDSENADGNDEECEEGLYDTIRSKLNASASKESVYDDNSDVGSSSNGEEMVEKTADTMKLGHDNDDVGFEWNSQDDMPRFDVEKSNKPDTDLPDVKEPLTNLDEDIEEYGSSFGIMRVYCTSELHGTWYGKKEFRCH